MARCCLKQGHYQAAVEALYQAKGTMRASLGHEESDCPCPLWVDYWVVFGQIRCLASDYATSRLFYIRAMEMQIKLFGGKRSHPMVALCLHRLGLLEYSQGNFARSAGYIEEALYMRLKLFDDDHPNVAASEMAKGQVLVALGKYDIAAVFLERAMVTFRVSLGPRYVYV